MDVSRSKRVLGFFFNLLTVDGFLIGNLILLLTSGRTIGGIVAGYKYEKGGARILFLYLMNITQAIASVLTFSIFGWYNLLTMGKRNGTCAEAWANNRKEATR